MTTRWTRTFLVWPNRWRRSNACDSTDMDHPRSREITLFARVRFKPTPKRLVSFWLLSWCLDADLHTSTTAAWCGPFPLTWRLWLPARALFYSCPLGIYIFRNQWLLIKASKVCILDMGNAIFGQVVWDEGEASSPLWDYKNLSGSQLKGSKSC